MASFEDSVQFLVTKGKVKKTGVTIEILQKENE
jgi:hypothetical protein